MTQTQPGARLKAPIPPMTQLGAAGCSLPRLVLRRGDRKEITVWRLRSQHSGEQGYDCAQWVQPNPPTTRLLEKEMNYHPLGTKFWLRRERHTDWSEWADGGVRVTG